MKSLIIRLTLSIIVISNVLSVKLNSNKQIPLNIRGIYGPTEVRAMPDSYVATRTDYPQISRPLEYVSFSNSNTSNQANPGQYTLSPDIINKRIVLESKEPITAVKSTPAQLGYRKNSLDIASKNSVTGLTENHRLESFDPIMGNVNSIHTLTAEIKTPMDLEYRRFEQTKTDIIPNRELNFYQ